MAESIAARARQLAWGSVSDLVDQIDPPKTEHGLEEALHDIEQLMGEAQREAARAAAARLQALRQAQRVREKIVELTNRAKDALQQTREDIAQSAIFEQLELEAQLIWLADAERDAANMENAIERDIATLYARRKEIEAALEATTRQHARAAAPIGLHAEPARLHIAANSVMPELRIASDAPDMSVRQKQVADRLAAMKAAM